MPQGEVCPYKESDEHPEEYSVRVTIKCDKNVKESVVQKASGFDTCTPNLVIKSNLLCEGTEFFTWIKILGIKESIVAFIFISLGLTIMLFGTKLRFILLVVIITITSSILIIFYVAPIFSFPLKISLVLALLLSILLSYFIELVVKISIILAVFGGYFIGSIIYSLLKIVFSFENPIYYLITISLTILIFIQITTKIEESFLIIISTFFGSILAIRGLGILSYTFPDESYLYQLLIHDESYQLKREVAQIFQLNFVPFALFIICGLLFQYSMLRHKEDNLENKEKEVTEKEKENKEIIEKEKSKNEDNNVNDFVSDI